MLIVGRIVLKYQVKHYKQYEKLVKMDLDQSVIETSDYKIFSEIYPYIAESIRLERKLNRLTNLLKSQKNNNKEFKIKREITRTKSKLQKNKLHKRLHSEKKIESIFRKKLKSGQSRKRESVTTRKYSDLVCKPFKKVQKKVSILIHNNLPPTLFNLRELTVTERGMALREWLKEKRDNLMN